MRDVRQTVKNKVVEYLKNSPGWVSNHELESLTDAWETNASNINRRARDARDEGLILSQRTKRGTIQFCHPSKKPLSTLEANQFIKSLGV